MEEVSDFGFRSFGVRDFKNKFQQASLVIALTTDNESAILVCGRNIMTALDSKFFSMTFSHYRCVAHVLNLGVKQELELVSNSVRKAHELMVKIKNSTQICDELRLLCNVKKIKYLKPLLDVKTRWNSTYYMLKRLEQLELALVLFLADHRFINNLYPNDDDWIVIKVTNKLILLFI